MTAAPWFKFYPSDWRGDAKLRSVCSGARGLWMDCLSLMHEAEPYGHLLVNGVPPDATRLGRLFGNTPKETTAWLKELEQAGVFSRSEDGIIYSRRMVRDNAKAERDRANGKGGGNPDLKPKGNGGVNPPANPNPNGGDKAQIPDTRKKDKVPTSSGADAPLADLRSIVWSEGLAELERITGLPRAKARTRLGQLLRDANDDCAGLMRVLRDCPETGDPQAWLTRSAQALARPREPPSKLGWMLGDPEPPTIDAESEPRNLLQ